MVKTAIKLKAMMERKAIDTPPNNIPWKYKYS